MRIVSWNVNSVKARLERVTAFIDRFKPEVLCLQELKGTEDTFPLDEFTSRGYEAAVFGQKTYNGVAILSTKPIETTRKNFQNGKDDDQARIIAARTHGVDVICAYVPNGQEVDSPKYSYKLDWLKRLRTYLDTHYKPKDRVVLVGDFNVAPDDIDVHDPDKWRGQILFSDKEKAALNNVLDFGMVDTFRTLHPGDQKFSWWDYRMLGFQKNKGLRIDFVFATDPMMKVCKDAWIERDERKGQKPSDHAPVVAEFTL